MSSSEDKIFSKATVAAKFAIPAAIAALIGIADATYLTIHRNELVPCIDNSFFDCGQVLHSSYSEIAGIPLTVFGLAAYIIAFILIILAFLVNRKFWLLFGIQVVLMATFSVWLFCLQAFVIKSFCQYCLLSATVCLTLCIIAIISKFWRFR